MCSLLLEQGAEVDKETSKDWFTALMLATLAGKWLSFCNLSVTFLLPFCYLSVTFPRLPKFEMKVTSSPFQVEVL